MRSALLLVFAAAAAAQDTAKPEWLYGHDLKVRKGGESDWDKAPKIGLESFKDAATDGAITITQAGWLTAQPATQPGANKNAPWLFGHDLLARKADEDKFSPTTGRFGIEVYKDGGAGKLLYLSEAGSPAFSPTANTGTDKGTDWNHALVLKVRNHKEEKFTDKTKKFGVEVFKDLNTGALIYITEGGQIALATTTLPKPAADAPKKPKTLNGFNVKVRGADEPDFNDQTKRIGIECQLDENSGNLVYLTETGGIAVVPPPADLKQDQGIEWKRSMVLKARPGGEPSFQKANRFGVEVFLDKNTGSTIYISDVGGIAVLPKK